MATDLTRYQQLLVKYIEAEYRLPFERAISVMRKSGNRYSDLCETFGCGRMTLREICKAHGWDDSHTKVIVGRPSVFPKATDFMKSFDSLEDAVVECRDPDKLALTVEEAAEKLGVSCSSVRKYTPEYLKYTQNLSKSGLQKKRESAGVPSENHPWRG